MAKKEYIACPLCKQKNERELFYKTSLRIVACDSCSLIYVNPRFNTKQTHIFYNKNLISPLDYYLENKDADKISFQKRLRLIEKFFAHKGKLLDIGSNIGTFLDVAHKAGWECYGIDVNKSVERFYNKKDINFFPLPLEKVKLKSEFFDVVIMNDVIEHFHQPSYTLEKVWNLLKPGGIIFIATPDVGSFLAKVMKKRWHHYKPNEHLIYFSRDTLSKLLRAKRFIVLDIQHIPRHRKIGTVLQKSESLFPFLSITKKVIPRLILNTILPFNFQDEMGVIAQKI